MCYDCYAQSRVHSGHAQATCHAHLMCCGSVKAPCTRAGIRCHQVRGPASLQQKHRRSNAVESYFALAHLICGRLFRVVPHRPSNRGCCRVQQHSSACMITERRWGLRGWSLSCFEVRVAPALTSDWWTVLPWRRLLCICSAACVLYRHRLPTNKRPFISCRFALSVGYSAQADHGVH